jgi:hypothetical protein
VILDLPSSIFDPRTNEVFTMTKCPFCHYENEDGSLFCEQCKSDLTSAVATAAPAVAEARVEEVAQALPVEALAPAPIAVAPLEHASEAQPVVEAVAEAVPIAAAQVVQAAPAQPVPTPVPATESGTVPAAAVPATETAAAPAAGFPEGAQPRLLVLRGQKRNVEYPIYDGLNFIGRADEKPVDIDLEEQEPPDRVWCSRQHACVSFENDQMTIEDLNSSNGTYVNRTRIYPGQKRPLAVNDIIQIGNVQLKVIV